MQWSFSKKSLLTLSSCSHGSMLAEVDRALAGHSGLRVLAETDSPVEAEVSLPRLLAGASRVHGRLAMTLPLAHFETVILTLPPLPDGAVGKALPYHLAKASNRPLSELLYDWQVTARFKDRIQVLVYLFPLAVFQRLRRELLKNQIEISHFEPDVFASCSFLKQEGLLPDGEASLCLVLWQDGISLAVHERGVLPLVRSVRLARPAGLPGQAGISVSGEKVEDKPVPPVEAKAPPQNDGELTLTIDETPVGQEDSPASFFADDDSLLSGFSLLSPEAGQGEEPENEPGPKAPSSSGTVIGWPEYLQRIGLEILRTRDYYASVQKGSPIRRVFIGGITGFWPEISERVEESIGIKAQQFSSDDNGEFCPSLLKILAAGTGARGQGSLGRVNLVPQRPLDAQIRQAILPLVGAFLVGVVLFLAVSDKLLQKKIKTIGRQVTAAQRLGDEIVILEARAVALAAAVEQEKKEIARLRASAARFEGLGHKKRTFSQVLSTITGAMLPTIRIEKIVFEKDGGLINGTALAYRDPSDFFSRLAASPLFEEVTLQDMDQAPGGEKGGFTFSIAFVFREGT